MITNSVAYELNSDFKKWADNVGDLIYMEEFEECYPYAPPPSPPDYCVFEKCVDENMCVLRDGYRYDTATGADMEVDSITFGCEVL